MHLLPWIGRRLTGRSSGDGRLPKRPELLPYGQAAADRPQAGPATADEPAYGS